MVPSYFVVLVTVPTVARPLRSSIESSTHTIYTTSSSRSFLSFYLPSIYIPSRSITPLSNPYLLLHPLSRDLPRRNRICRPNKPNTHQDQLPPIEVFPPGFPGKHTYHYYMGSNSCPSNPSPLPDLQNVSSRDRDPLQPSTAE